MSYGKAIFGLMAGVAIGATLGVLFAPDKGAKTRKKIMGKGNDYIDEMEGKFNDFIDEIREKVDSIKDEADDAAERGKNKMKAAGNKIPE